MEVHRVPLLRALQSEVHVWLARAGEEAGPAAASGGLESLLDEEERAQHRRFRRDGDRDLYLLAHALLRTTLSRYAEVTPQQWRFSRRPGGRPEIELPAGAPPLRFSLSHTPGCAACAVALELDVGVDVEGNRSLHHFPGLARYTLAPEELREIEAFPEAARPERFLALWTLKEACLKARGTGLSSSMRELHFRVGDDGRARVRFSPSFGDSDEAWQFMTWRPAGTHHLAAALRRGAGPERRFVLMDADFSGAPA